MLRWSWLFSIVVISGCGGVSDVPELGVVTGKLMLDGKPTSGMSVEFHPDSTAGTKGPLSSGISDVDGYFTLFTGGGEKGAVVGKHKVVVKCPFNLEGRSDGAITADGFGSAASGAAPAAKKPVSDCKLPLKYESASTTPLSQDVTAAGLSDLVLEISTQ